MLVLTVVMVAGVKLGSGLVEVAASESLGEAVSAEASGSVTATDSVAYSVFSLTKGSDLEASEASSPDSEAKL